MAKKKVKISGGYVTVKKRDKKTGRVKMVKVRRKPYTMMVTVKKTKKAKKGGKKRRR